MMTDRIKERSKNPTLRLARQLAAARLKRAGVTLSKDFSRHPAKPPAPAEVEETFPAELIRRLAGG
jgi:hypothetical protein